MNRTQIHEPGSWRLREPGPGVSFDRYDPHAAAAAHLRLEAAARRREQHMALRTVPARAPSATPRPPYLRRTGGVRLQARTLSAARAAAKFNPYPATTTPPRPRRDRRASYRAITAVLREAGAAGMGTRAIAAAAGVPMSKVSNYIWSYCQDGAVVRLGNLVDGRARRAYRWALRECLPAQAQASA